MTNTKKTLNLAFVDFSKALDSLIHDCLLNSLLNQRIPKLYIKTIGKMYEGSMARIITDMEGEYFPLKKGVKQGDSLSPILFNCELEDIFRIELGGNRINRRKKFK